MSRRLDFLTANTTHTRRVESSPLSAGTEAASANTAPDSTNSKATESRLEDFETVLLDHSAKIERFCARLTNWHSDAADLAQDVFVIAYERWSSFRGDSATETWLMGIALRVYRNWQRKQSIKTKVLGLLGQRGADHQPPSAEAQDQCDDLRRALARVDVQSREILVLHYLEHKSIEAIATSLNCSRAATDKRLSRARKRLAVQLKDYA